MTGRLVPYRTPAPSRAVGIKRALETLEMDYGIDSSRYTLYLRPPGSGRPAACALGILALRAGVDPNRLNGHSTLSDDEAARVTAIFAISDGEQCLMAEISDYYGRYAACDYIRGLL